MHSKRRVISGVDGFESSCIDYGFFHRHDFRAGRLEDDSLRNDNSLNFHRSLPSCKK